MLSNMETVLLTNGTPSPATREISNCFICSVACTGIVNNCAAWNVDKIPFDNDNFTKTANNTNIIVKTGGIYHL